MAQQKADFIASSLSECNSLITTFTDRSTGNPVSWKWDFGNKSSSVEQNPKATYVNPGAYTVTLTVTYADGSTAQEIKTNYITVRANPVVDFSISNTKGCAPFTTTFTDRSLPGDGTLQSFSWDFGDGSAALNNGNNPTHTYTKAGTYSVVLTVTNSYGCTGYKQQDSAVEAVATVNADFNVTQKNFCTAPATVQFSNTSTSTGSITYRWDFDDSTSSNLQDPGQHTFTTKGTHSITLTATDGLGCSTSKTVADINVADFLTTLTLPSPVCTYIDATYKGSFSPIQPTSISWEFNGQNGGTGDSVSYTPASAGLLTVKLTALYGSCTDVVEKSVTVNPSPGGAFTTDYQPGCILPVTVNFQNNTTGASSWKWYFGDQQSSTLQNPSHTYSSEGYYNIYLLATSAEGCTYTSYGYLDILTTKISLSATNLSGCEGMTTTLNATSNNGDQIKSYTWDFGDASPTSSEASPQHVYSSPDTATVQLQYTTATGCTGKVQSSSPIKIYKKPTPDFSSPDTPKVCGNNIAKFNGTTDIGDRYIWNFGDNSGGNDTSLHASHSYRSPGTYDVSLTVYNQTCADTIIKKAFITAILPFPRFSINPVNCSNRLTVSLKESSLGANTWKWSWGDGTDTAYITKSNTITHTYSKPGTYLIKLTTTNGICTTSDSTNATIIDTSSVIITSDKTTLCSSDTLTASISNADHVIYSTTPFYWQLNGNTQNISENNDNSYKYTAISPGQQKIRLLALNKVGCFDTSNVINLTVRGPLANYKVPAAACRGTSVTFTDATDLTYSSSIKKWQWNFGDDTAIETFTSSPFKHSYLKAATNINPVVTVTDENGCVNTYNGKYIQINGPNASFSASDYLIKPGSDISFTNTSTEVGGNITGVRWNFGDGNTSTANQQVVHNYPNIGVYTVKLQITDNLGCTGEAEKNIKVSTVAAGFSYTASSVNGSNCAPMLFTFTNTSVNAIAYFWNFGDGNTSDQVNPVHTYVTSGHYIVDLKVTGADGATDEVQQTVIVKGPFATIQTSAKGGCEIKDIVFTITPQGATTFTWDFTDGNVEQTDSLQITHLFKTPGIYNPRLLMKDSAGCKGSAFLDHQIVIDQLRTQLHFSPALFCDTGTIYFAPVFNSFSINQLGIPGTYTWTYDTTLSSSGINTATPQFYFNKPGTYEFGLSVQTAYGCEETIKDTINVYPRPLVAITAPDTACQGIPITFSGSVTKVMDVIWKWDFSNGNTASQQQPAPQVFSVPNNYTVKLSVSSNEGCVNETTHLISIMPLPDVKASAPSNFICLNSSINLHAEGGINYQWTPATGLDSPFSAHPIASPTVSTTYNITVTDSNGCINQDTIKLRVVQPFTVQASPDTALCLGEKLALHVSGADSYLWQSTGIDSLTSATPNITFTTAGSYIFDVTGYDKEGCFSDHTSVKVTVNPVPTVNAGPDQEVLAGTPVTLVSTNSNDVVKWRWSPATYLDCDSCQHTTALPNLTTRYTVQVESDHGCNASDEIVIHVICNKEAIFMPTAFTPNQDGLNESIYPKGKGVKEIEWLRIYDRWGSLIFENTHFQINVAAAGWNGRSKDKEAPVGSYIYTMRTVCESGEKYTFKGSITLIK